VSCEICKPIDTVNKYISFEVFTAVILHIMVFWVVTPGSTISGY
jgi:hypothetical protein